MGQVGNIYLNFGLWALAIVPSWLVIRQFGLHSDDKKMERERGRVGGEEGKSSVVVQNKVAV